MNLHSFKFSKKERRPTKKFGRGRGSGHGKTCGRGGKGQSARTGYSQKRGFEGGQNPIQRRLPKRGFTNIFRKEFSPVNVSKLAEAFEKDAVVTLDSLKDKGLVPKATKLVKILGDGEIGFALKVEVHAVSQGAREKIEGAGGSVQLLS